MQIIFYPCIAWIWINFHPHRILNMGFTWHKKLGITFIIIIIINSQYIRWVPDGYHDISYLPSIGRISTGGQYVTPDSKIYCEKVKICRFSRGNWFFCPKYVQLVVAGKRRNIAVHLQKRVINWTWLRLSISDWSIIMIGRGGFLLVVPTNMEFQLQFYWWGCQKKTS